MHELSCGFLPLLRNPSPSHVSHPPSSQTCRAWSHSSSTLTLLLLRFQSKSTENRFYNPCNIQMCPAIYLIGCTGPRAANSGLSPALHAVWKCPHAPSLLRAKERKRRRRVDGTKLLFLLSSLLSFLMRSRKSFSFPSSHGACLKQFGGN